MSEPLIGVISLIVFILISWLSHFLKNAVSFKIDELHNLAQYRRFDDINQSCGFSVYQIDVNPVFKSKMKVSGSFYKINQELNSFPSLAASLLKGKKHEWVVVAFCKNAKVNTMWANKGQDNSSVGISIGFDGIVEYSKSLDADMLLHLHNHPNAVLQASEQDILSAENCGRAMNSAGANYVAFVVGRGQFHQYAWWFKDDFLPITNYLSSVKKENIDTMSNNYRMRMELKRRIATHRASSSDTRISTNILSITHNVTKRD